MTAREFAAYWMENNLDKKYSEAQSEEEKMEILEELGLSEYKEEAARQVWLAGIRDEYHRRNSSNRAPQNSRELMSRFEDFKDYLDSFELRDYEVESLVLAHTAYLVSLGLREGIIGREDFRYALKELGMSELLEE